MNTLKTPQTIVWKKKSVGKKYKPFTIGKTTQKMKFGEESSPTHY
jgi:hypothetical protein